MATRVRVTRLANPRRRVAGTRRRRVAASRKRVRNAKGHFVSTTKRNHRKRTVAKANPVRRRRRNAKPKVVTRYKTRTRTVVKYRNRYIKAKSNPVRRRKNRAHSKRRAHRRNPALLVTLGAVNPRRRKKAMAHRRRRHRRNPTTVTVRRNRRHSYRAKARSHRRRRNTSYRRRNPVLFGHNMSSTQVVKSVVAGLVGVTVAKLVPPMLPSALTSSPAMRVIATGVTAFVAGMLGNKMGADIGGAVLFGGLMQTASQALNAFVPSIGSQIGLSGGRGMGMLVPGGFPIPQNPVNVAALAPAPAMVPVKGTGVGAWQGRGVMAA